MEEVIEKNIQEVIKRVKLGRPRSNFMTPEERKEYRREYYENNKDKYMGDFLCVHCNVIISKSNKSRHSNSKIHLYNKELKKNN